MRFITDDKQERIVDIHEEIGFSSTSAYHLIALTARVKGEKQLNGNTTDDEDLTVQIDGKSFPKLYSNNDLIDSPAAFSGGKQHNLSKTVYFLTYLQGRDHKLVLNTDNPPGTATFEKMEIYTFGSVDQLTFEPKIQAEDGDRRSWIAFALDSIPLQGIEISITYSRRKRDSDDVKVKIDGQTQGNILRSIKNFFWYFAGLLIPKIPPTKTESRTFETNFSSGLHYIELDADRMPTLEKVTLNFGSQPSIPKRVPTANDPEWTENFDDDTEVILLARVIFGEAEDQPKEAKIGVGFTVVNRVKKQRSNWGLNIRDVILGTDHYNAMWDKNTLDKVRDPLNKAGEDRKKAWLDSYKAAAGILDESLTDPTSGATNFHSFNDPQMFPSWATEKNFKIKIGAIYFYELES